MSRQTLRDDKHHIVGFIDIEASGKQTLLDPTFHKLGTYDPRTNQTKDEFHHPVGYGNLLTSLLPAQK